MNTIYLITSLQEGGCDVVFNGVLTEPYIDALYNRQQLLLEVGNRLWWDVPSTATRAPPTISSRHTE